MSLKFAIPGTSTHGGEVKSAAVASALLVDINTACGIASYCCEYIRERQRMRVLYDKDVGLKRVWGIWVWEMKFGIWGVGSRIWVVRAMRGR